MDRGTRLGATRQEDGRREIRPGLYRNPSSLGIKAQREGPVLSSEDEAISGDGPA